VFDTECIEIREIISKMGTGQPIEIRAPTPKQEGPKITQEDIDRWNGLTDQFGSLDALLQKLDGEVDKLTSHQKDILAKLDTFALKEELSKTNHDVKILQEDNILNQQDIKTIFDELSKIKAQMEKFATKDELNLLRGRIE
jgi:hypothetical protein